MLSKKIKPKLKITQLIRKNFSKKRSIRNKARLTKETNQRRKLILSRKKN